MGDAEAARLAREMGVPLEDASAIYAQANAEAPFDPARALTRYIELLHGSRSVDAPRRLRWPGKRALTTRISSVGSQPRRNPGRSWPGQHALTSRLAAPAAVQYALRSAEPNASPDDHVDAPIDQVLRYSRGTPLGADLRRLLEGIFWQRFDDVLIHVDNSATTAATSINARAFTIANRIFFREDAYRPDTRSGLELIAHELAHVVQWRQGRVPQVNGASRVSDPGDALEREATATAQGATRAAVDAAHELAHAPGPTITLDASLAAGAGTGQPFTRPHALVAPSAFATTSAVTVATRGPGGQPAPTLAEIQGFRHIHFMIDGESPALRAAVAAELAALRTANPGWTFTAEFGIKIDLPPVPGTGQLDDD